MAHDTYFDWLTDATPTTWWHDSGDPDELDQALAWQAHGVTTNPVLAARAIAAQPDYWLPKLGDFDGLEGGAKVDHLVEAVVRDALKKLAPVYEATRHAEGYVCSQVNPSDAGKREEMLARARHYASWGPNVAIKLPVTAAGLDVLEELIAEGTTVTATVSFTVPQLMAVAERHKAGCCRARDNGVEPGHCFPVMMIGRLDDYIREAAQDNRADVTESDIRQGGIACVKLVYKLYREAGYEARLLIASHRHTQHIQELAGGEFILSISTGFQQAMMAPDIPRESRIDVPVSKDVIDRMCKMPEFAKAYYPDGMTPDQFVTFGSTQRTLSQFVELGWNPLLNYTRP